MTRTALDMEAEGVRPRGRPNVRYRDTIRRDITNNWLATSTFLTAMTGELQYPGRPTDVEEPSR